MPVAQHPADGCTIGEIPGVWVHLCRNTREVRVFPGRVVWGMQYILASRHVTRKRNTKHRNQQTRAHPSCLAQHHTRGNAKVSSVGGEHGRSRPTEWITPSRIHRQSGWIDVRHAGRPGWRQFACAEGNEPGRGRSGRPPKGRALIQAVDCLRLEGEGG